MARLTDLATLVKFSFELCRSLVRARHSEQKLVEVAMMLQMRMALFMMAFVAGTHMPQLVRAQSPEAAHITATSTLAVEDELRILSMIARMNQAVDLADYPLYASFYAEDGVIDSGFGPPVTGRDAIVASLEQSAPFITNKRHAATNIVVNGEGDTATAVYYLIVFERVAGLDLTGTAVITDTFRRGAGGWEVVLHQTRMDPATLATLQQ